MSSIKFNSVEQIQDACLEPTINEVNMVSKSGDEYTFFITEIESTDFFQIYQEMSGIDLVNANGDKITDVSNVQDAKVNMSQRDQMEMAVKLFCLALVDENGDKIGNEEKTAKFIKRSFGINELTKVLTVVFDIMGISKQAQVETAKN